MRERLSRERVLSEAVSLADGAGMDGLTMRGLAERLAVVPMALYKHVADKNELLDGMVDLVFAEVELPPGEGWRVALRARAVSMRQALLRHPWAVGRMETGTPGPANLRHHNAVLGCLRAGAGFDFSTAVHAYNVLDAYTYGFALQEKTLAADIPGEAARRHDVVAQRQPADIKDYPYLVEVAVELARTGFDFELEFTFGLDLVLDGLERLAPGPRPTR
jgi:AcrR family transcriptional regulator